MADDKIPFQPQGEESKERDVQPGRGLDLPPDLPPAANLRGQALGEPLDFSPQNFELVPLQPQASSGDVIDSVDRSRQVDIPLWSGADDILEGIGSGLRIVRDQVGEFVTGTLADVLEKGLQPQRESFKQAIEEERRALQAQEAVFSERIEQELGRPVDSITQGLARDFTRVGLYTPIYIPLAAAGMGPVTASIVGGTIAAQLAFETDEPRFSDLLAEFDTPILGPVARALQFDEDDPESLSQLKQFIEETLFGVATVGGVKIGGTVSRSVAKKGKNLVNRTIGLRRQKEATAVAGQAGEHLGTSFRSRVAEADTTVAKAADDILRRTTSDDEVVRRAALRIRGRIFTADTHPDALLKASEKLGADAVELADEAGEAGFVTNRGRFVSREIAAQMEGRTGNQFSETLRGRLTRDEALREFERKIRDVQTSFSVESPDGATVTPFTKHDVKKKMEVFQRRLDAGDVPPGTDRNRLNALRRSIEANDRAVEEASKTTLSRTASKVRRTLRESLVDRSGTLKREILQEGGEEADRAINNFILAQGAGIAAQKTFNGAWRRIFQDLSKTDKKQLADLIRLRRIRTIKEMRPEWEPPFKPKGMKTTSVDDFDGLLQEMRTELGEEQWAKLGRHADDYFSEIIKPLDILQESGVISAEERIRLRRFQYSPIRFLEELDPVVAQTEVRGRPISIRSSGIQALKRGQRELMLNSPEDFLAQVVGRAHGRAFRNRANQGLFNFAKANPDNPVVRTSKPKEGEWTQISVMFDGEAQSMFLRNDLVPAWQLDPIAAPTWLSILSGTVFIRPLATGALAPEFAPVNFAYNTMFTVLAGGAGKLYSPILPKATIQLGRDLRATAKDAFLRTGAFDNYIDEGGGMALLTHQGRIAGAAETALPKVQSAWKAFERYGGYVNETAEIWVRLAARNRVLRNKLAQKGFLTPDDQREATAIARRLPDFSQGGVVSKKIDQVFPYFNAAVQGFRETGRAVKQSPIEMSVKFAQLGGIFGTMWYANHLVNPEAWEQVPKHVKDSNLVFTTPFFRTDRDGNRRYMYFKVPLEHTIRPINTLVSAMMERSITGKMPDNTTMRILKEGAQILPGIGSMPPSASAAIALAANFDWWRGDTIWRGDTSLPPTFERTITGERPTSVLSRDIAEGINPLFEQLGAKDLRVSPARLDVAARSLFPRSVYTDLVGAGYHELTEGIEDDVIDRHTRSVQEGLAKDPFVRRFIGETHPFTADVDALRDAQEVASGEAFLRREEILRQIDAFKLEGEFGRRQQEMVARWIEEQDPIYQPGLAEYLKKQIKMEEVFKRFDPESIPFTPSRTWWRWLSGAKPRARASAFWDQWTDAHLAMESEDKETAEAARRRLRMMRGLARNVPGFNPKTSKEFGMELERLARDTDIPLP